MTQGRGARLNSAANFCRQGPHASRRHGSGRGHDRDGGRGEAVRVPQAQGTLVPLPVGEDSPLLPSLLTLPDVFCTGHHAPVTAEVGPRSSVTVRAEQYGDVPMAFGVFYRNITLTG
jgi:threonine dehydrogenase-like Zn-dependent dehydrogenase